MTASVSGVATGVGKNDQATSVALLRDMLRIRELEQRSLDLSTATPPEVIGSAHFCAGQEAASHRDSLYERGIIPQFVLARMAHLTVGNEVWLFEILENNGDRRTVQRLTVGVA